MILRPLLRRLVPTTFALVVLALTGVITPAQEKRSPMEQNARDVKLQRIVLFNSGVGFFEHGGTVRDDASLELRFNVDDINDLLKSMVVQDLDGGHVSTVSYASRDPVTKALQTFAIDLTESPSLADLLRQVRGESVELEAELKGKPQKVTGTILGVEIRKRPVGDEDDGKVIEIPLLTLVSPAGLRNIPLDDVTTIRLLNETLNQELNQALAILAQGHATDKKTVTLNFTGEGERGVRIGYIQETPIWKTSYRLVLDEEEQPFLQGWAIVENTTEEDWNDVDLSLVSGRPISFRMDLYQPLYVARPLVVPELYASLMPPKYDQDLAEAERQFEKAGDREVAAMAPPAPMAEAQRKFGTPPGARMESDRLSESRRARAAGRPGPAVDAFSMQRGVQSVAQAENVGELFQYKIDTRVTLARQKSAMLPIVNSKIKGEKLSIYNASVHAKHPLNGLRLVNSTELHLMQGPITVFDGGAYAGDARIDDLPPESERLISYALDLDVEVAPQSRSLPEELLSVRIVRGTLYTSRKLAKSQTFTVKNSSSKPRKVLIESPLSSDWKLVAPKEPTEKTRDLYRFAVVAQPGKAETLKIEEEQVVAQAVALTNLDESTIAVYLRSSAVSPKVKSALEEVIRRKQQLAELVAKRQQLQGRIKVIEEEQSRIRQNMAQLDRTSDIYKRYIEKFAEQEDLNDETREEIDEITEQEQKLRRELNEFLESLEVG